MRLVRRFKKLLLIPVFLFSIQAVGFCDGIDGYVVLMLHCDGSNGSTTFTDSSSSAHTTSTVQSDAQLSTTNPKFGTASFSDTNGYFEYSDHADWDFDSGDFTIDFWFKWEGSNQNYQSWFSRGDSKWSFRTNSSGDTYFYAPWPGSVLNFAYTYTKSTWYHIEVDRWGTGSNQAKIFVNGTAQTTGTLSTAITFDTALTVGAEDDHSHSLYGNMDEIRFSKGVARHTTDFTVPSSPYSSSALKTINDLAKASVKTVNGLAIASVKTVNGLA